MSNRSPLSSDPITVTVGNHFVSVPHCNAVEWVNAIHAGAGPDTLVLKMARETTAELITDALISGDVTAENVSEASYELLRQAVPYQWWKTARLLFLSARPDVLGRTVTLGMDPWALTVGQWCAGVYALCTEHADQKAQFKFDATLEQPPVGVEDDEWGADSFDAMVAQARRMPGVG